jgi:competence protein ComEC
VNGKIFYITIAGLVTGILISSYGWTGFSLFLLMLITSLVIFYFGLRLVSDKKRQQNIFWLALFILCLGLGILRFTVGQTRPNEDLSSLIGEKVTLSGLVLSEPAVNDNTQKIILTVNNVIHDQATTSVSGQVLVQAGLSPVINYGDRLKVSGTLSVPTTNTKATSTVAEQFDYGQYLAKDDVFYQLSFAQVSVISHNEGNYIKSNLLKFKNSFMGNLNQLLLEPESSFMGGLLLGAKASLSKEWVTIFSRSGVSHLVALSGYNITIVAEGIMKVLAFLPGYLSLFGGVLGIIGFVIMAGGSSTAVRASLMALLVLLAKAVGRQYDITRALAIAGIFLLLVNPKILVFDLSFQLSFLATLAMIYVAPILSGRLKFITEKFGLREMASATLSAQIVVLPLLLHKMGWLSLVALPVNLMILPFIPLTMLAGFLAGSLNYLSPFLAWPFATLSHFLLASELGIAKFFASLSIAGFQIYNFSFGFMIFCYVILLLGVIYFYEQDKKLEQKKK